MIWTCTAVSVLSPFPLLFMNYTPIFQSCKSIPAFATIDEYNVTGLKYRQQIICNDYSNRRTNKAQLKCHTKSQLERYLAVRP